MTQPQPPDWVINTPPTESVHNIPGGTANTTGIIPPDQLKLICAQLLGGVPFLNGLMDLGRDQDPSTAGSLAAGGQTLADTLCGFFTGNNTSGTTPQSLLSGVSDVNNFLQGNSLFAQLLSLGGGGNGNLVLDALQGVDKVADDVTGFLTAGARSVHDGLNDLLGLLVSGQLAARLLRNVPVGALAEEPPNMLTAPTFADGAIATNPDWTIDPSKSRTNDSTGAAKVVVDGIPKALRTGKNVNDWMLVSPGQKISFTIYIAHQGANGKVSLQAVPYTNGTPGDPEPLYLEEAPLPNGGAAVPAIYNTEGVPNRDWPGAELTGIYEVPEGVEGIQLRIVVEGVGTFWIDDAEAKKVPRLRQEWMDGLPEALQDLLGRIQLTIDSIFNALTGGSSFFNTLEDLVEALLNIPNRNVEGVGGPRSIGEAIISFFNQLIAGLVGEPPAGDASPSDAYNIAKIISSRASQGSFAWEVVNYRNNTSIDNGLLPSSEASINLSVVNTTLEATQDASLIGVVRVERSAPLGVVSWLGYGTTNLDAFYINIWRIDYDTGNWELAHHSENILGEVHPGPDPGWNFYFLPDGEQVARVAGEVYAYELVPVGSGTHYVRGVSSADDIPDHPYVPLVIAATRDNSIDPDDPPGTLSAVDIVRSQDIPFIESAIDVNADPTHRDPVEIYLTQSTTVPIPNWANRVDLIALGGGGGASQGLPTLFGRAGEPGKFNAITLVKGEDFFEGDVVVFTRGEGGEGGSGGGANGENSVLEVNSSSVVAEGGAGGSGYRLLSSDVGYGPENFEYNGRTFVGGGNQYATGQDGVAPGGAGNGGNGFGIQPGGNGAPGAAWIVFRQEEVEDEVEDITPPTPPTEIQILEVTHSSITVMITGGTDDN